jgi:glycosyltransferase involved in cell wall biosynthesis
MDIGIYLGTLPAEAGGGFTFENEVLSCLLAAHAQSAHRFTLFRDAAEAGVALRPGLRFVSLQADAARPALSLVSRVQRRVGRLAQDLSRPLPEDPLRTLRRYETLVRQSGIDILFNLVPWSTLSMDLPYINIVWDLMHQTDPYYPEVSHGGVWESREAIYSTLLRRAAVLIATPAVKLDLERYYQIPPQRIRILHYPTPQFALTAPPETANLAREKYGLQGNYFLYPAQFWPHKNHVGLLLALQILRQRTPAEVVFVGADKGNREYVRQLAQRLGLEPAVHFLGFVPREDLVSLYRHAAALTYVSLADPDNFPPLEAFALGCPVAASNTPGSAEQLGDAALFFDPRRPEHIASTLATLLENASLRSELIRKGKERAARFSAESYARGLFSIFDELEPIRRTWGTAC